MSIAALVLVSLELPNHLGNPQIHHIKITNVATTAHTKIIVSSRVRMRVRGEEKEKVPNGLQ